MSQHVLVTAAAYLLGPNEPAGTELRHQFEVADRTEVYRRLVRVDSPNLTKLDLGWNPNASVVLLCVVSPQRSVNPTPEEAVADKAARLEVVLHKPYGPEQESDLIVLPNEPTLIRPGRVDQIYVRCPAGPVDVIVYAFPR